jgi:hypothetical protein
LQGFPRRDLGGVIGADARGLAAIIVVSGTFGHECLHNYHSGATG